MYEVVAIGLGAQAAVVAGATCAAVLRVSREVGT